MPNSNSSALSSLFCSQTFSEPPATNAFPTLKDVKTELSLLSSVSDIRSLADIPVRKSCEFSHHSPACIKKAANNLNKIQERLEEWYRYVLTAGESKQQNVTTKRTKMGYYELKLENINSGSSLKISGYDDAVTPDQNIDSELPEIKDIPQKNMQVVKGVINLLERVELDRINMVKLLEKECERTVKLREMVDASAYKRIHDLPNKVQEEHDKCICDIRELKWHFEYQSRIEAKLVEQMKQAESLSKMLLEDKNLVMENDPLLEEKLQMEDKAMKIIQQKQNQTDNELSTATVEMDMITHEFEKLKLKAEHDQRIMAQKVSSLSGELNSNLDLFLNAQKDHVKMKADIISLKSNIDEDIKNTVSGEKHLENLTEIGIFLKEKVEQCKANIIEQKDKYDSLLEDDQSIKRDKEKHNRRLVDMRKELETELSHNTRELRKMIMLNKKTKKEIQVFKKKIDDCEKNRISNEKAARRAVTELETIQEDLLLIKEQALDLRHLQISLQLKADQENSKATEEEEKLSEQSASLQKENKEESHARKILLARIKAESTSFEHKKNQSEMKKQKILQTDEDLKKIIENITEQMKKLSVKYEERSKAIEGLDRLLAQVAEKSSYFNKTTSNELKLLESQENTLKFSISEVLSKQDHMDETTDQLNKKLNDMESSTVMMNKFLSGNETAIEELQEEIDELQMQLNTSNRLDETLKISLVEVQDRSSNQQKKHSNLIYSRRKKLDSISKLLAKSLEENDRLATKYLNLQSKHINEKNEFVSTYEKNMIAQESLRDKESLCELHTRLHEALKCYYQLRGIQTKAGLSRFEDMTKTTYARLKNIQNNLERCIYNISVFLKASNRRHKLPIQNLAINTQNLMPVFS